MHTVSTYQTNSPVNYQRHLLRLPEVMQRTGLKRTHIYTLMSRNEFPQKVKIGLRAVAWDSVEIDQWVSERLNSRAPAFKPASVH